MRKAFVLPVLALALLAGLPAQAKTVCTVFAEHPSGKVLRQEGDCATRVTPASTFKIALALIGFDSGILKSAHEPEWPYKPGYPDWQETWKQPTDPTRWMALSVVWYSQQITKALGAQKLADALKGFSYGNADLSGDPGQNNGLERAWLGSSLKISPQEQSAFLSRILSRSLKVSSAAYDGLDAIVERRDLPDGGIARGKTGFAYVRLVDGTQDKAHPFGWYVGWAQKGGRTLVFVRLNQGESEKDVPASTLARDTLLSELPQLLDRASP